MPVMCETERAQKIEDVDFFAQQMKRRVWGNFNDFDEQVRAHGEEVYEVLKSATGTEHMDEADIADFAVEESVKYSELLSELQRDLSLAAVATLYHRWEKELRRFLARELRNSAEDPDAMWTRPTDRVVGWLEEHGWPLRSSYWFPVLDSCRLIVNVHKHGKGWSLKELNNKYRQCLNLPTGGHNDDREQVPTCLDHRTLYIMEEHFDQFVGAIRRFWINFPREIHLEKPY